MRVLALDYGAARCGCAVSDPSGTIVRPLDPVLRPDPPTVAALVGELEADVVVVGLPVTPSGEEGSQAAESREFASKLADRVSVPVELHDERLTTRLALRTAREVGSGSSVDSLAAAHLLESWLEERSRR